MSDVSPTSSTFASSIVAPVPQPADGPVTVTDRSELTKVVIKTTPARPDGPAIPFGSSRAVDGALVCGSRPGEWFVLGRADAVGAVVSASTAHTVDWTHSRALIEVAGPAATKALEKVCSLDWSDAMMPDGAVVSASVAKVSCDIVRRDDRQQPAYLLAVDRSFAQYLYEALVDAAGEFTS